MWPALSFQYLTTREPSIEQVEVALAALEEALDRPLYDRSEVRNTMNLESKLDDLEKTFVDLEKQMSDPVVAANLKEIQQLAKKHAQIESAVLKYREYKKVKSDLEEAHSLLHSGMGICRNLLGKR